MKRSHFSELAELVEGDLVLHPQDKSPKATKAPKAPEPPPCRTWWLWQPQRSTKKTKIPPSQLKGYLARVELGEGSIWIEDSWGNCFPWFYQGDRAPQGAKWAFPWDDDGQDEEEEEDLDEQEE